MTASGAGAADGARPARTTVAPLAEQEARALTERIRHAADDLWALLLEAHEGRAWAALGYRTWEEYVRAEFDMSRSRAYQLVDHGLVVRELERVAGVSTSVDVTEAAARDIRPHLEVVKDAIRQAVESVPEERVAEIVAEVVEEERARIVQERQDREELAALAEEFDPGPDFDWDRDRELLREGGAIFRVVEELAAFRDPAAFVADHGGDINEHLVGTARRAHEWLSGFLSMTEA